MLSGIHPLLTGRLLLHLDEMGHSDAVVLADAHFPAQRVADRSSGRVLDFPAVGTPELLAAVRTVLPLDHDSTPGENHTLRLMQSADGSRLPVQEELIAAAGITDDQQVAFEDRWQFYTSADNAYLIVRTGETRVYGNAILYKGVVT